MHFVAEFLLLIITDLLWSGICYATGSVLILVISRRQVAPGHWLKKKDGGESQKIIEIQKLSDSPRYMAATTVALIGLLFWLVVIFASWAISRITST